MLEIALANINSFASAPYSTQAVDILNQILQRQQDLERKVSDLETEAQNLKDELAISKADNCKLRTEVQELQTRIASLEEKIERGVNDGEDGYGIQETVTEVVQSLKERVEGLAEKQDASRWLLNERIDDVWTVIEDQYKSAQPTKKTTAHVDNLHKSMRHHKLKQVSFAEAGKLLGIHHNRALQLKSLIATDDRFVIVRDPNHKQRLFIRLKVYM